MDENAKNILVVDDEEHIRKFIQINLQRSGFRVVQCGSGEEAIAAFAGEKIDLCLLDIMLPGMSGYEVFSQLRAMNSRLPIIMLTAMSQDMDKVMGLELGADDYVAKPFNPLELVARIRSVLRRTEGTEGLPEGSEHKDACDCFGAFRYDLYRKQLFYQDVRIVLTNRERSLLEMFLANREHPVSRDEILDQAWGEDFVGDPKTVDVHVRRLREKMMRYTPDGCCIETVWGYGYCWREGAQ